MKTERKTNSRDKPKPSTLTILIPANEKQTESQAAGKHPAERKLTTMQSCSFMATWNVQQLPWYIIRYEFHPYGPISQKMHTKLQ